MCQRLRRVPTRAAGSRRLKRFAEPELPAALPPRTFRPEAHPPIQGERVRIALVRVEPHCTAASCGSTSGRERNKPPPYAAPPCLGYDKDIFELCLKG